MTSSAFHFTTRVYYEDTDAAGVVYYANYLKFAERARSEWLRELGFEQRELMQKDGVGFVVRRCLIDYLRPAKLDDCLTIITRVEDIKNVSLRMQQEIRRTHELLATLEVKLGVVGKDFMPARLPDAVKHAFIHSHAKKV